MPKRRKRIRRNNSHFYKKLRGLPKRECAGCLRVIGEGSFRSPETHYCELCEESPGWYYYATVQDRPALPHSVSENWFIVGGFDASYEAAGVARAFLKPLDQLVRAR